MLSKLYEYYQDCQHPDNFNEKANDLHWIRAYKDYDRKIIKLGYEPLEDIYMKPPYLVVPHYFFDYFLGITVRDFDGHYLSLNQVGFNFYTSYEALGKDKKVSDTILLSEGPLDAEALSFIHPYSYACLGSLPSKRVLCGLLSICSKIVFVADNDEAGQNHKWNLKDFIESYDFDVEYRFVDLPDSVEDAGEWFLRDNFREDRDFMEFSIRLNREI